MQPRVPVAVLVSGNGSTLQAVIDATTSGEYPLEIVAVGSDNPEAYGLTRAAEAGIATFVVTRDGYESKSNWDTALAEAIGGFSPDWVLAAGFMRILGPAVLARFAGRIVNTHPALLPSFPGAHGVADALAHGVKVSGCTVHLVDAGVDTGPVIAQAAVPVLDDDDEDSLRTRIQEMERALVVDVMARIARHGYTLTDRKVTIP